MSEVGLDGVHQYFRLPTPRFQSNQSLWTKNGWILGSIGCTNGSYCHIFFVSDWLLKVKHSNVSVVYQAMFNQSCSCLDAIDFQVWMQPLIGCWKNWATVFLSHCCVATKTMRKKQLFVLVYDYLSKTLFSECVAESDCERMEDFVKLRERMKKWRRLFSNGCHKTRWPFNGLLTYRRLHRRFQGSLPEESTRTLKPWPECKIPMCVMLDIKLSVCI